MNKTVQKLYEYIVENDGLSVSEGTLRESDLLYSLIPIAEIFFIDKDGNNIVTDARENLDECQEFLEEHGDFGYYYDLRNKVSEEKLDRMIYLLHDWIFLHLDNLAPKNFYFGANMGDGSSIGFYRIEDEEED